MGSTSSGKSRRSPANVGESLAFAWSWLGSHRLITLGIALAITAVVANVAWNSLQTPVVMTDDDDDDELKALGLFDELPVDPEPTAVTSRHRDSRKSTLTPTAEFDDLSPLFAVPGAARSAVVTATFEGTPPASTPVWLAGTIETDDESDSLSIAPYAPGPIQQASGPFLVPQ